MQKVLRGTFWKIRRIQIQMYPQSFIDIEQSVFYLNNNVSAHGLVLLVQLSCRIAPPLAGNGDKNHLRQFPTKIPGLVWFSCRQQNPRLNEQFEYSNHVSRENNFFPNLSQSDKSVLEIMFLLSQPKYAKLGRNVYLTPYVNMLHVIIDFLDLSIKYISYEALQAFATISVSQR